MDARVSGMHPKGLRPPHPPYAILVIVIDHNHSVMGCDCDASQMLVIVVIGAVIVVMGPVIGVMVCDGLCWSFLGQVALCLPTQQSQP